VAASGGGSAPSPSCHAAKASSDTGACAWPWTRRNLHSRSLTRLPLATESDRLDANEALPVGWRRLLSVNAWSIPVIELSGRL
jgi:hypothetical protein